MPKFISKKTKRETVRDYKSQELTIGQIAEKHGVSPESVRRWSGYKLRSRISKKAKTHSVNSNVPVPGKRATRKPWVKNTSIINANLRWSKSEDALLNDAVNDKLSVKETMELLGRSAASIHSRKCLLTNKGMIKDDIRFSHSKGIKRPRRKQEVIMSAPEVVREVVKEEVKDHTKAIPPKAPTPKAFNININSIGLEDLAAMVKSYGVSVTVLVTELGTEVKLHN